MTDVVGASCHACGEPIPADDATFGLPLCDRCLHSPDAESDEAAAMEDDDTLFLWALVGPGCTSRGD